MGRSGDGGGGMVITAITAAVVTRITGGILILARRRALMLLIIMARTHTIIIRGVRVVRGIMGVDANVRGGGRMRRGRRRKGAGSTSRDYFFVSGMRSLIFE